MRLATNPSGVPLLAAGLQNEEIGGATNVYRGDRCIVRLYGGVARKRGRTPWNADTRIVIFSATKGLMAAALHLAHEEGRVGRDQPVDNQWPAFAQGGEGNISIRILLNHLLA